MEKKYIAAISAKSFFGPLLLSFTLNIICKFNVQCFLLSFLIITLITFFVLYNQFKSNQFYKAVSDLI